MGIGRNSYPFFWRNDMTVLEKKTESPMADKFKEARKENSRMVRGVFRFHEVPGGTMKFVFREFPGDPVANYAMTDGQEYEVPLGVAKHLNKDCWYPQHQHIVDARGNPIVSEGKKVRRCSFQSLDFMEV